MSDYVTAELLIEILVKLPSKSLIRYTTVCKSWHSLITSPSFVCSHILENKNHALLLKRFHRRVHYSLLKVADDEVFSVISSSKLEFPVKSEVRYIRIVGSCNGLVCLYNDALPPLGPLIIWNPSIRSHVVLPKATLSLRRPSVSTFGFGVAGDDYKVVKLVYCIRLADFVYKIPPHVEVFSLKIGKWQRAEGVDVKLRIFRVTWSPAFLKGVVHWLAYESIDDNNSPTRNSILGFQLDKEVFTEVLLPNELAEEYAHQLSSFLIEESLAVVKNYRERGNKSCDVWMMKDYGVKKSWTKLYKIDLLKGMQKVIAFWRSGEVLVAHKMSAFRESGEAFMAYRGSELVAYNPETKQTRNLGIDKVSFSLYVHNYVESLVLLKGL